MAINMDERRRSLKVKEVVTFTNVFDCNFDEWEDAANHELIMLLAIDFRDDAITFDEFSTGLVEILTGE